MALYIPLLMCLAVVASGEAMDEHVHVDEHFHMDSHERVSVCMTSNSPVQAAETASKEAYAAAQLKVTEISTAADEGYTKSMAAAKNIFDATVANALTQKNAGFRAANLKKAEMEGSATARAAEKKAEETEKIDDLRREAEQRVVERTHQLMKSIQANHEAEVAKEEQDLKAVNKAAMEAAHKLKAGSQDSQLTKTKQAFSDVNTKHKEALDKAFNDYVIGKHKAEIDSASLKKSLEDRATKAEADDKKIYLATYDKQKALADSERAASEAAAKAKKADMLADAQAQVKQAEMQAWVDTMSKEMDANKLCNGDHLSAAGAAAAKAHLEKTGKVGTSNSALESMGHNDKARISLLAEQHGWPTPARMQQDKE